MAVFLTFESHELGKVTISQNWRAVRHGGGLAPTASSPWPSGGRRLGVQKRSPETLDPVPMNNYVSSAAAAHWVVVSFLRRKNVEN